jgi:hypothetical protein
VIASTDRKGLGTEQAYESAGIPHDFRWGVSVATRGTRSATEPDLILSHHPATFTIITFDDSSLRWLEIST